MVEANRSSAALTTKFIKSRAGVSGVLAVDTAVVMLSGGDYKGTDVQLIARSSMSPQLRQEGRGVQAGTKIALRL